MSGGRKHRRALARSRAVEALRAADHEPAVYLGEAAEGSLWKKGKVMFVLARPQRGMPAELVDAIALRNAASLSGECPACGARRHVRARPGHVGAANFTHEPGCVAGERADALARSHGWRPSKTWP